MAIMVLYNDCSIIYDKKFEFSFHKTVILVQFIENYKILFPLNRFIKLTEEWYL